MNEVMMKLPDDHPLMKAWETHKTSEAYANSKRWAAYPEHVEGSLWALFAAGWEARADNDALSKEPRG